MATRRTRSARDGKRSDSSRSAAATAESEDAPELAFEEGLERLESLVGELEDGDLQLEAALEAFEEGVKLTRQLDQQLRDAEQRVEVLLEEGGRFVTEPLEEEDGDGA